MDTIQKTASRKKDALPTTLSRPLLSRSAGPLALAAGALLIVGQPIWWPFDQVKNPATSVNPIFNLGSVIYLCGFYVLVLALIGVHGYQSTRAGRFGTFGFSAAVVGTMLLGGDLWFESFVVPWLAGGSYPRFSALTRPRCSPWGR
jgi:hypothetical protein